MEGQSYNDTVDQWCLGILCYEFLVGRPPFESPDSENTYAKIRRLEIDYPSYLSIGAKDLIAGVSNYFLIFALCFFTCNNAIVSEYSICHLVTAKEP